MRRALLPLFGIALAGIVSGCASNNESPQRTASPYAGANNPEQSDMLAPLRVLVEQGTVNAATGETDILVHFDVPNALKYPVSVVVTPPQSGQLTAGAAQETLALNQPGRLTRAYRIHTSGPLSVSDPFRITVDGQSANGVVGLHAAKQFPEAAPLTYGRQGPAIPGGRPPSMTPPIQPH